MAAADTPHLILNAPLVGHPARLSRSFGARPAGTVRLRSSGAVLRADAQGAGPRAGIGGAGQRRRCARAAPAGRRRALLETCESDDWPEREGAWSALQSLARLRWPWAQVLAPHIRQPERGESWLFSRLPEWEEAPERPAARDKSTLDPAEVAARLDRPDRRWRGAARGTARLCRRGRLDLRPARTPRRAAHAARPGRNRDRQDAGLSRACLAVGGKIGRHGVGLDLHQEPPAPIAARKPTRLAGRRARRFAAGGGAQGPRELPVPAQSGRCAAGRLRRAGGGAGAARRALGRLSARTATWSAATCPAGSARCSATARSARSPTSAANASMPAARITANASSNAPGARARRPTW